MKEGFNIDMMVYVCRDLSFEANPKTLTILYPAISFLSIDIDSIS